MKQGFLILSAALLMAASPSQDFGGATPEPRGKVAESVDQLRIRFPSSVNKGLLGQKEAFKVSCTPAVEGFSSWADNNTLWTYNFKSKDEYSSARLAGGTECEVTQLEELSSTEGPKWTAGQIQYKVMISGPNVEEVHPARGFKGTLRDHEPVMLLVFDGPVDRARFFSEQNGYLHYLSANAPGEKIPLQPLPEDQVEKVLSYYTKGDDVDLDAKAQNWVLATVQQKLIPGAEVSLTVSNQVSAANPHIRAEKKYTHDFLVRSQFQAEVQCANPSAKNAHCLPRSPINVLLNGRAKWTDIKKSYIEYIPYKSNDGKRVRSYPELNQEVSLWESFLNALVDYFPFLAKYSDTVVDSIVFHVHIEPETQATVVLPKDLADIEGRVLANALTEFHVRIGTMEELIHVPKKMAFFEKNVPRLYLPVGIVNLNQKISIRKTGTDPQRWEPIQDVASMIQIIRGYEARGNYRETEAYKSPLDTLGVKNTLIGQQLTGARHRPHFLQFPFAEAGKTPSSGLYALEISSPSFEAGHSDSSSEQYYNPKYVLAQVTDLAIHLKKGTHHHLAWVTRLSSSQSVPGAEVRIYNCLGEQVLSLKADAEGLVRFPNQEWATDCKAPQDAYSPYFTKSDFFISARSDEDISLVHSTWMSPQSYAFSAPGVEWFYNDLTENQVHFHSVVGVNLVKPGQQVPMELMAKLPHARGLSEARAEQLPKTARISYAEDSDIYYEFPLSWKNGVAHLTWNVPNESSLKLGRYELTLMGPETNQVVTVSSGDIEVAEFKVPLMSGIIAFPNQALVQPQSLPVSTVIRYANGVGAKKLPVEMSYYFEPTFLTHKELAEFQFGTGPVKWSGDDSRGLEEVLPRYNRPATIPGLHTAEDGSLVKDLALEKVSDGRSLAAVLKTVDRPQKLVVRVRYQDQTGEYQTLSQAKDIYHSHEYVGTRLISGDRHKAQLRAAVVDVNQHNKTDLNHLEIKVIRVETKVMGEELYGGLIKNTLERELKPVRWKEPCTLQKQIVSCPVGALKAGNYAFQVTSKNSKQAAHTLFKVDAEGRVYGESDYYNFGDEDSSKQLPLALDKKIYKHGERAVVSFPTPFKSCRALVTLERSDVIESFISNSACEKGFVEIPVNASLAPNVFVSVYAITGRAPTAAVKMGEMDLGRPTYRLGFANIKVNWSQFKSLVTVKTNKEKYQPGENVDVEVTVKPEEGHLQGGTVTVVAIEEKILELKPNTTYQVLDALMQLRGHEVSTVTLLEKVETVTADNTDLPDEKDTRKGGDEGGDGGASADFKRKLFNALVAFHPGVPVVNGIAKVSFKTNDSLTRFKIFAIATDAAQKFGTGEAVYLTEKDTQAYSNIPTVAHSGDRYPLKVTVQNNSGKTARYKTEVEVVIRDQNGKEIGRKTFTKQADIPASASEAIDVGEFTVDEEAGRIEYVVRIYDENGKLVDVMEPEAQVILSSVPLAIHDSYILAVENGVVTQELTKEPEAHPDKGEIRVSLSSSLVSGAVHEIQQRLQRDPFAGFFLEYQFHKALLTSSESKPEELKRVLESLIQSLDSRGFVKYYPQARQGSLWLTAEILNGLQQESWALKLMPSALSEKLKSAVANVLEKSVPPEYVGTQPLDWARAQAVMARAAFAFADATLVEKAKALNQKITAELKRNPAPYGLALEKWTNKDLLKVWLLQVAANPATASGSPLYTQLMGPSRLVSIGNGAQLKGQPSSSFFYSDETAETAQLLMGHAKLGLDKNKARSLAVGLANVSAKGWYNTVTMGTVAQGLKMFGRSYEGAAVTGTTRVSVPEQQMGTSVDWSKSKTHAMVSSWTKPRATVQVTHAGQGAPWVGIQGLTAVPLTAARGQGLAVEKEIRNVTREESTGFQAGDVLEVTLKVTAAGAVNHVALADPIPAGSNILNQAYGDYSSAQKSYSGYQFYFEVLPAGTLVVKYQVQLNNPGRFKLPPTRAEALYTPSVFGETPNAAVTVK